ncbi:hypothetical protein V495_00993 [Pseudogymnoascus sp. VKM F-4514 (FW-929)]|nr:hypothetical protein V495_00993 [Pseudogymnoascus sp. VKM F-4514 (FW-929)]KFY66790.1 hypothetical protein V497_00692 [Pseudogymnoascus sp. VKM F-4516 (FW-969)]
MQATPVDGPVGCDDIGLGIGELRGRTGARTLDDRLTTEVKVDDEKATNGLLRASDKEKSLQSYLLHASTT